MHDNNSIDGGVILPDPLIDSDVDLRDFAYMPLDVVRFRDSDFTAITDGEAFKAGVLLWCASWHQVPAGSLQMMIVFLQILRVLVASLGNG